MRKMKSRVGPAVWRRLVSISPASRVLVVALAASFWLPTLASASILASDNFEGYPTGAIAGLNGGTGWAGAWTETAAGNPSKNVVDTSSSPLVYAIPSGQTIDGATRGVEVQMPGASTAGLLQRQLSSPLSQTYYVGYLVRYVGSAGGTWAGANNTFTLHLGIDATTTGTTLNFGLRGDTGGGGTANEFVMRVGTGAPVAGASTGGQLTNDTTYYLVCEYTWGGSGFTSAKMWLNPTLSDITDTPGGDASLTFASPIGATTHVFWRATVWENTDIVRVDELKIGTAWGDVVPPGGPVNPPPSVTLTNPANGTSFLSPASILLQATASDTNGTVTNVAFYAGATKLADDATEPYSFNWTGVSAGSYALTARATDNQGASTVSTVVNITVTNALPSVSLTNPVNGASFLAPASILLEATASDSNGTVTNVAFYAGTTKLADDATEPYSFNWTGVFAGSYALTAVARDNEGGSRTSSVVNITVTNVSSVLAEDSFNYLSLGGGALHGRNGGSGWAGAWATNGLGNQAVSADATGNALQFTPAGGATIDGSAEAVDITGTVNQPVAFRQLASPQTGTFYVAYLMRLVSGAWSGTATFSVHLADSGNNINTLNFGARGGSDFMVRNGTANPLTDDSFGGTLAPNTTYYLVARLSKPASSTYDQIDMWLNPGLTSSNTPDVTLNLTNGTGLASISHLFIRAAALDADDVVRVDELRLGSSWTDVVTPWFGTPAVDSFTLMYPGTGGPVPGYDPITNNATINLFLTGTNLSLRANTSPGFDFGSVAFNLTGATTQSQTDSAYPWSLFGDSGGSYTGGVFNVGAHSLTGTPYPADGGGGTAGIPASINFTTVNTVVITNQLPTVTLTNPLNAATFTAPADITLQATASDHDGSVTNVEFFAGAVKLGQAASAPYDFLWTNVTAGAYTLTARATDNQGGVGISPGATISVLSTNTNGVVTGELKKWHKVTITWDGPDTSETNANNPFRNYRLNVTFTHPTSGKSYLVPGFFAADGDAANSSAQGGNQWRVHFAPDETGTWNYIASFRAGTDVALSSSPTAGAPSDFDGTGGSFVIGPTDKTGRDLRSKGRLHYVGKHHLRFAETGEYFLKMGADSPESLLDYADFDDQPPGATYLKTWYGHTNDYDALDAAEFTWKGGKGTNLLGGIKYLSDKGMNAFSFIPFTIGGDDKNVCPQLLKGTSSNPSWSSGVHHDRLDVSRMEQWDRIFTYGDKKGMYLHFKTQETENELLMDGGNLGPERILYYRELIARFGYHLALNWNLGEEIDSATTAQKQAWSQYFYDNDPYHHNQVIHNGSDHYDLLGTASHLTGFSLQKGWGSSVFTATLDYLSRSDAAGVPWVVALDEPGGANDGIQPDAADPTHDSRRGGVIWAHVLAGGAGVESYFGYSYASSGDLTCQSWRNYDTWWNQCRYALEFFRSNAIPFQNMTNRDSLLTGVSSTHCFALAGQVYVGYLPAPGAPNLNLSGVAGQFTVRWFDPRNGGIMQTGSVAQVTGGSTVSLGSPPSGGDWAVLVKLIPPADTTPPSVSITAPTNGASLFANLPVTVSATVTDNVAVAFAELWVDGSIQPPAKTNAPYDFLLSGLSLGGHTLAVIGQDSSANRATNSVSVTLLAPAQPPMTLVTTGGVTQLFWSAPGFALQQANVVFGPWTNLVPQPASPWVITPTNPETYFRLRWSAP